MTEGAPKRTLPPSSMHPAAQSDDQLALELRRLGPLGILAILIILFSNFELRLGSSGFPLMVPLSALLVLLWAWRSRTPWSEIGLVRPQNWIATITLGAVFGCAFKLLLKAI